MVSRESIRLSRLERLFGMKDRELEKERIMLEIAGDRMRILERDGHAVFECPLRLFICPERFRKVHGRKRTKGLLRLVRFASPRMSVKEKETENLKIQ